MKRIECPLHCKSIKFRPKCKFFVILQSVHLLHTSRPSSRVNDQTELSYLLILSSKSKSLPLGQQVHGQIVKLGISTHISSLNTLISVYSKCGALGHAVKLFDDMPAKNLVSWTSIISGAVQDHKLELGLELFLEMMGYGFQPNEFTFGSVLKACAELEAVEFGLSTHCLSLKMGIDMNLFVGSLLIHMYSKCRDIVSAENVFRFLNDCDLPCWNALVGGYAMNGCRFEVLEMLSLMHQQGLVLDEFTFISALKGCSVSGYLNFGQQIHGFTIRNTAEFSSSVMNSLMNMYFKTRRSDCALKIFNRMQIKDVISWNTALSGFAQDKNVSEAVDVFSKMFLIGVKSNQVTLSILFRLCGTVGDLFLGLQFCCLAYRLGLLAEALVCNSVIYMFSRCGDIQSAHSVFKNLNTKDIITWNEMIVGYNLNGCETKALWLFYDLLRFGIFVDDVTWSSILGAVSRNEHQKICLQFHAGIIKCGFGSLSSVCCPLINAYARLGWVDDSYKIFCSLSVLDAVSWGAMIAAFSQQGRSYEALVLLNHLRETGEKPDEFILGSTLNACANSLAFNQSKCIHLYAIKTGFDMHACIASAVIDAYAKCGDINSSRMVFYQFSGNYDAILFNTMITAYAHHGLLTETIALFDRMKHTNLQPNHATFVSVISACSHFGFVDLGRKFFNSISSDYRMKPSPKNYACLIDLLARNGFLEEAREIIEDMPFEPWTAVWRSLLSGCRIHGNRELGQLVAEQLLHLMPDNDAAYMLLSEMYAEEGKLGRFCNGEEKDERKRSPERTWMQLD